MEVSSEDEELIILLGCAEVLFQLRKRNRRKKRTIWVNPYLSERRIKGRFASDDMRKNPSIFKENFHVRPDQFDYLLSLVGVAISAKAQTRPEDGITPPEKLAMTLEYLASGSLQRHIASCYRVSKQRIGPIIEETCSEIVRTLQGLVMSNLTTEKWIEVSNTFHSLWNFPNCVGAVDGKHVSIKCPKNGGSAFFNHKGFHSIVLMGIADADCRFLYYDIGGYGSEGDSNIFKSCQFGKSLMQEKLALPPPSIVHGRSIPFVFLADDAFPLHKNLMKPFKPTRSVSRLSEEERIFNYRLSRARRCIENAFGILCARWLCLSRTMFMNPDRAQLIIAACCLLHNYLMGQNNKDDYSPQGFSDHYDNNGALVEGNWRKVIPSSSLFNSTIPVGQFGRPNARAQEVRIHLKNYFNSDEGEVSWQRKSVFLN